MRGALVAPLAEAGEQAVRIAIDLDGVLYNWEKTARFMLEQEFGYHLDVSDSWTYLPDHVSAEAWHWLWHDGVREGLFRYGHVVKGGVRAVRQLYEEGHELYAVTHRPVSSVRDTHAWLDFMQLPFRKRYVLSDGRPKWKVAADLLIDDKPENVREWTERGRYAILFRQPWNDGVVGTQKLWIAQGWMYIPWMAQIMERRIDGDV